MTADEEVARLRAQLEAERAQTQLAQHLAEDALKELKVLDGRLFGFNPQDRGKLGEIADSLKTMVDTLSQQVRDFEARIAAAVIKGPADTKASIAVDLIKWGAGIVAVAIAAFFGGHH